MQDFLQIFVNESPNCAKQFPDRRDFISIIEQNQDFPKHFHETFCISLIRNGIEKIDFGDSFLYSGENAISITNPFEVHSNPVVDKDLKVSFDTIYISNDLLKFLFNGKNIIFENKQIENHSLVNSFNLLLFELNSNQKNTIENELRNFTELLFPFSQSAGKKSQKTFHSDYLNELILYIETHIEDKFYLDELAKLTHQNKFGFSKKFKSITGISAMNYVLMKKIFSAKKIMENNQTINLTELAYDFSFTDLAHFSRTFKQYIGISPKTFLNRKNCQDYTSSCL